jgi:hypothetical protein
MEAADRSARCGETYVPAQTAWFGPREERMARKRFACGPFWMTVERRGYSVLSKKHLAAVAGWILAIMQRVCTAGA